MSAPKKIVLITGANGGIGFELAAQLLAKGSYHVLLGSRSLDKGEAALKDIKSRNLPGSVELIQLDATSDDSIHAAVKTVEHGHGRLDILVNNAAIGGIGPAWEKISLRQNLRECFDTNATGVAIIVDEFAPLLRKSAEPRIVNVSSGAGSIAHKSDPQNIRYDFNEYPYRASKAAMNMITACQWAKLKDEGFKVFAFCPGHTVSNLSHLNKAEFGAKSTADGVRPLVDIIEGKRDAEVGKFLNIGGQYPW